VTQDDSPPAGPTGEPPDMLDRRLDAAVRTVRLLRPRLADMTPHEQELLVHAAEALGVAETALRDEQPELADAALCAAAAALCRIVPWRDEDPDAYLRASVEQLERARTTVQNVHLRHLRARGATCMPPRSRTRDRRPRARSARRRAAGARSGTDPGDDDAEHDGPPILATWRAAG
jgi:hypothetical protein